ncbi:MAG TPA: hypothetical protein PKE65_05740 [Rhizobiaceae bacterium]|nr:hypothetical protein [Rhizobiaceae bacterium]
MSKAYPAGENRGAGGLEGTGSPRTGLRGNVPNVVFVSGGGLAQFGLKCGAAVTYADSAKENVTAAYAAAR